LQYKLESARVRVAFKIPQSMINNKIAIKAANRALPSCLAALPLQLTRATDHTAWGVRTHVVLVEKALGF
jgi:hypothetical protein